MPWAAEGENLSFSGPISDLMSLIMSIYDADVQAAKPESGIVLPDGADAPVAATADDIETCPGLPSPGTYVTATAIALRSMLIDALENNEDATEFVERLEAGVVENDDGSISVATFEMLDEIADHIDLDAITEWLSSSDVHDAVMTLAVDSQPVV